MVGGLATAILQIRLQRANQSLRDGWIVNFAILQAFKVNLGIVEVDVLDLEIQQLRYAQPKREPDQKHAFVALGVAVILSNNFDHRLQFFRRHALDVAFLPSATALSWFHSWAHGYSLLRHNGTSVNFESSTILPSALISAVLSAVCTFGTSTQDQIENTLRRAWQQPNSNPAGGKLPKGTGSDETVDPGAGSPAPSSLRFSL